MRKVTRLVLLLIMVASRSTAFAYDDDHELNERDHDRARSLHESGVIVPLEEVVAKVQASYPDSKVLEAKLKGKAPGLVYEIEIVDKAGVVRELYFDARNGVLLRTRQE